MSVGICGKIKLRCSKETINISYHIQEIAIKNNIGCKLGGNVSEYVYDIYGRHGDNYLYFEITNSPIDNFADELLQPSVKQSKDSSKEMKNELYGNVDRIKQFIVSVLEMQTVQKIYLDINYLFRENKRYSKISINKFTEYICDEYEKEGFFMPPIGILIQR